MSSAPKHGDGSPAKRELLPAAEPASSRYEHFGTWLALADHLRATGDIPGADAAYMQHVKSAVHDARLLDAAVALCRNLIPKAEALLRAHLKEHPTDVAAIRMFAELAARIGRHGDAENLLARCLELAPSFTAARYNYALILHRRNKAAEALREADSLIEVDPNNPSHRNLKAVILGRIGDYAESLDLYEEVLAQAPHQPKVWMSYGHALRAAGREHESVAAYRQCIKLTPECGEAWWSLANLKTFRFTDADLKAMRQQLSRSHLENEDRFHFHFAIGKALEDAGLYSESFEHYSNGNNLRRSAIAYDPEETSAQCRRSQSLFTRDFFRERAGFGCAAADPIFIVGLPRSGSTLIEQILSSHSAVEGTMELPNIAAIARDLRGNSRDCENANYSQVLSALSADDCRALGERYLQEVRIQRKTGAPFFIDKMPNNFLYVGLIQLILPNARIIDARRHPLGCCLSAFKQHFARGQHFSYSLKDLGRYYREYVELMAHFDGALPGRIHRVIYEHMVENTEIEVKRLLTYCGLPFEEGCLRFYENQRAVRTASSQQVRRPIFRDALEHWRRYEPWLGGLKSELGLLLQAYPQVPEGGQTAFH